MSIYKDYFDSINSERNDNEIIEGVTSHRKKRPSVYKRTTVAFAAVFMALGISVTAYAAAFNWDFDAIVESWLGKKAELIEDCFTEVKIENSVDEMENADISIRGAVCDNGVTTIFFDIERTDGKVFDEEPAIRTDYFGNPILKENGEPVYDVPKIEFDGGITIFSPKFNYHITSDLIEYTVNDEVKSDNKITIAAILANHNDIYDHILDSESRIEVSILFYGINTWKLAPYDKDGAYYHKVTDHIAGKWYARATFDYKNVKDKTLSVEDEIKLPMCNDTDKASELKVEEVDLKLNRISVTSLSIKLNIGYKQDEVIRYLQTKKDGGIGRLYMKDGTSYPIGHNDSSLPSYYNAIRGDGYDPFNGKIMRYYVSYEITYMLPEPIDLNEVDYFEISGKTYKF